MPNKLKRIRCIRCNEIKSREEFITNIRISRICKECHYREQKIKQLNKHDWADVLYFELKIFCGRTNIPLSDTITPHVFRALYTLQNGKCAISQEPLILPNKCCIKNTLRSAAKQSGISPDLFPQLPAFARKSNVLPFTLDNILLTTKKTANILSLFLSLSDFYSYLKNVCVPRQFPSTDKIREEVLKLHFNE